MVRLDDTHAEEDIMELRARLYTVRGCTRGAREQLNCDKTGVIPSLAAPSRAWARSSMGTDRWLGTGYAQVQQEHAVGMQPTADEGIGGSVTTHIPLARRGVAS